MLAAHPARASTSTAPLRCRHVHHTARLLAKSVNHYETLQLPKTATRQQIKAQFYRLSKEYHPDVKSGNEAKFQQISEAYTTLGSADARRAYDASLTASSSVDGSHGYGGSRAHYAQHDSETGSSRRSHANYAWEYARRTNPRYQHGNRANPFASQGQHPHGQGTYSQHQDSHFDRMQARAAWRASNVSEGARKKAMYESQQFAKEEDLRNTSSISRAFQMVAMFLGVLWIGGVLRAGAWEKDDLDWDDVCTESHSEQRTDRPSSLADDKKQRSGDVDSLQ